MTMTSVNEFKDGLTIEYNNGLWRIVEFQHAKPGKGSAFVRSRLKNLRTGIVQEYTFHSTAKINTTSIQTKVIQYLHNDDISFVFMDITTYEQLEILETQVERESKFLKKNMVVSVTMHDSETLSVDLPNMVDLEVVETEPNVKDDTSSGGGKPVTTEVGLVVNVPFFIGQDDVSIINTANGTYVSCASK